MYSDQPLKSTGMKSKATQRAIKEILKDGTPDWVSHPEHYRQMAEEDRQAHLENARRAAAHYKVRGQDILADFGTRFVNIMSATEFMRKLRSAGVTCWSHESQLRNGTAGLHCVTQSWNGAKPIYVASIQVPWMCEWTIVRTDAHGLVTGFRFIGWRDAVKALITKKVLTEAQAHKVFGAPREAAVSSLYREDLKAFRNNGAKQ
jgi:hypothetical protein